MKCDHCGKYIIDDIPIVTTKEQGKDKFGLDEINEFEFCSMNCAAEHFTSKDIWKLREMLDELRLDLILNEEDYNEDDYEEHKTEVQNLIDEIETRIAEYRESIQCYIGIRDEAMELKEKGA